MPDLADRAEVIRNPAVDPDEPLALFENDWSDTQAASSNHVQDFTDVGGIALHAQSSDSRS